MKKHNFILLLYVILFASSLTACSAQTEVRDRAFVKSINISDKGNEKTVKLSDINGDYTGSGKTIFKAIENAEITQDKSLFIGHTNYISISDGNVKKSLVSLLESNLIPPNCYLIYGDGATDKETIENIARKGELCAVTVSDTLDSMLGITGTAASPYAKGDKLQMAIISDKGLVDVLSKDEARGLALLTKKQHNIILPIEIDGETFSYEAEMTSPKIKAYIRDGEPYALFTLKVRGKNLDGDINFTDKDIYNAVLPYFNAILEKSVNKNHVDILNIEKSLRQNSPDYKITTEFLDNITFGLKIETVK